MKLFTILAVGRKSWGVTFSTLWTWKKLGRVITEAQSQYWQPSAQITHIGGGELAGWCHRQGGAPSTPPPQSQTERLAEGFTLCSSETERRGGKEWSGKEEAQVWVLKLWQWTGEVSSHLPGRSWHQSLIHPVCCHSILHYLSIVPDSIVINNCIVSFVKICP